MRERYKTNYDKLNSNDVTFQRESFYYNNLEKYARLLELKLQFYKYEHKNAETMKIIENRNSGSRRFNKNRGGWDVVIPDCFYGCNSAPCSCHEDWILYKKLEKQLKHSKYPTLCTDLDDVLEKMDKNFLYRRVVN